MKSILLFCGIAFLLLIGMTISYNQGINNGKVSLCQSMGLKYGKTISGDECLTENDINLNFQNSEYKPLNQSWGVVNG